MRKKLLTLALTAAMVLSFAACGSKDDSKGAADNGSSSTTQSTPTQSSAPEESSSQAEDDAMTLADWLETADAKQAESATNSALASSGMSVTLAADGNMFVYEYHLGADLDIPSSDALDAAFGPVIEANKSGLDSLFSSFESVYGIKLDGARFVFFDSEGNEIYSGEVMNE